MATRPATDDPSRLGYLLTATALITVFGFMTAGCSNTTNPSPPSVDGRPAAATPTTLTPAAEDCGATNYPLIDIPSEAREEPRMKIPQPPGWEVRQTKGEEHLRFVLTNQALNANHFSPTVTVTMGGPTAGGWAPRQMSAQELFDDERSGIKSSIPGTEIQSSVPATVCGQPAEISDYTTRLEGVSAPLFGKLLMVAAKSENETYLAVLTVLTTDRDDPVYHRESQAILDGFVILPSDSAG